MRKRMTVAAAVLAVMAMWATAGEGDSIKAARQVLKDNQGAVVWVSAVVKSHMSGRGAMFGPAQEQKVETLGTIIDPSGLTVVSASMLDPMSLLGMFLQQMGDESADQDKMQAKSDISNIKIRMADGKEVAARLVLTDPDVDLSFLVPEKSEGKELPKFVPVQMTDGAKPEVLDELISLSRLGKNLDRQPVVSIARLAAVVIKPRSFYVPAETGQGALGTPVFALDRKPVGIVVLRKAPPSGGIMSMMNMGASQAITPVILPAADVMEVAEQALKKGDAADKPAAKTDKPADKPATEKKE